jgi:hypothetical protein
MIFHEDAEPNASLLRHLEWQDIDLDGKKITIAGSTAVIGGERVNGTTKSGRTWVISIDGETVARGPGDPTGKELDQFAGVPGHDEIVAMVPAAIYSYPAWEDTSTGEPAYNELGSSGTRLRRQHG